MAEEAFPAELLDAVTVALMGQICTHSEGELMPMHEEYAGGRQPAHPLGARNTIRSCPAQLVGDRNLSSPSHSRHAEQQPAPGAVVPSAASTAAVHRPRPQEEGFFDSRESARRWLDEEADGSDEEESDESDGGTAHQRGPKHPRVESGHWPPSQAGQAGRGRQRSSSGGSGSMRAGGSTQEARGASRGFAGSAAASMQASPPVWASRKAAHSSQPPAHTSRSRANSEETKAAGPPYTIRMPTTEAGVKDKAQLPSPPPASPVQAPYHGKGYMPRRMMKDELEGVEDMDVEAADVSSNKARGRTQARTSFGSGSASGSEEEAGGPGSGDEHFPDDGDVSAWLHGTSDWWTS